MAHIRNNCLKENTLQVEINQQCQDISNISGNDCCDELIDGLDNLENKVDIVDDKIDMLSYQSEECCDTINDKLDIINSKLKPKIFIKKEYVDKIVYKVIQTIVYKTDYVISYRDCSKKPGQPKYEVIVPEKSVIKKIVTTPALNPCFVYENELKRDIENSRKRWEKDKYKTYKTFGWMVWELYSDRKLFKPKCWEPVYRKVVYEIFGEQLPEPKRKKRNE